MNSALLKKLARLVRYYSLVSTTAAGSGHPSSSLSAADLMATLMFGGFFYADLDNPARPTNDRLIFSKGHASPLFYSLYAAAGAVTEAELLTMRQFGSPLEGHPAMAFRYTEAATGSLGQGLSVGVGMALNAKYLDRLPYRTWVLLGDSEMTEGSVWEAVELAAHYRLSNLVGVLDGNRLGQRGETMVGHRLREYQKRLRAFGWKTITVDGHDVAKIAAAYRVAVRERGRPIMVIAKTFKGKGVSLMENNNGWHGKALSKDELASTLKEFGPVDKNIRGIVKLPLAIRPSKLYAKLKFQSPKPAVRSQQSEAQYSIGEKVATRKAYGQALVDLAPRYPNLVVLDAEVSNSTFAETFKKIHPERFFEMFVAEQNMAGAALGLSRRGKIPFVSSFAAFLTRAHDQIRMCQYSDANIKFVGSHVGVSIGEDGASQMGLEDLAMFRALHGSTVLYPADAVATKKLVAAAAEKPGLVYLRTTRSDTPVLYKSDEAFPIGGSKTLRESGGDAVTVVAAGITLYEALAAYEILKKEGISIRIIDLYSIKPLDVATLKRAARETKGIITAEDHYPEGGLGEAVAAALSTERLLVPVHRLAVVNLPRSGRPTELLAFEHIDRSAIVTAVKGLGQA